MKVRDDSRLYKAWRSAEGRFVKHGIYMMIWSSLTQEEQRIMALRHSPKTYKAVMCDRRLSDVREGSGMSVLSHLRDEEGNLTGYVRVEDVVGIEWDNAEIAAALQLSERQVRSKVQKANRKILLHPLLAALAEDNAW